MLFGIEEVRESVAATSMTRSLLFAGEVHQYPVPVCFNLMFLKVLDALAIRFYEFPEKVVKLLLLRYLALTPNGKLPSSICNLQQLQFLIVSRYHNIKLLRDSHSTFLPKEIWEMQQLKYIRIMGLNLPDPINSAQLPKLSTLYVNSHSCTEAIFRCLPNLKKIGIIIELQPDSSAQSLGCLEHIGILENLTSLKCVIVNPRLLRFQIVAPPYQLSNLPKHLMKLSLNGLGCSWKCMTAIGSLPYLKVLKVRCFAFQGPTWETEARQFQRLQYLLLEDIDLVEWTISEDHCFPALQCLTIRHCYKLKAIPREIRGVRVINWIKMELVDCNPSVVASELKMPVRPIVNSSWNL